MLTLYYNLGLKKKSTELSEQKTKLEKSSKNKDISDEKCSSVSSSCDPVQLLTCQKQPNFAFIIRKISQKRRSKMRLVSVNHSIQVVLDIKCT